MQKVWSISGRSIAVSALALALTACQSMRTRTSDKVIFLEAIVMALQVHLLQNKAIKTFSLTLAYCK